LRLFFLFLFTVVLSVEPLAADSLQSSLESGGTNVLVNRIRGWFADCGLPVDERIVFRAVPAGRPAAGTYSAADLSVEYVSMDSGKEAARFWQNVSAFLTGGRWKWKAFFRNDTEMFRTGRLGLIFILAHELGHYVKQYYSVDWELYGHAFDRYEDEYYANMMAASLFAWLGGKYPAEYPELKKWFLAHFDATLALVPDSVRARAGDPGSGFQKKINEDYSSDMEAYYYIQYRQMRDLLTAQTISPLDEYVRQMIDPVRVRFVAQLKFRNPGGTCRTVLDISAACRKGGIDPSLDVLTCQADGSVVFLHKEELCVLGRNGSLARYYRKPHTNRLPVAPSVLRKVNNAIMIGFPVNRGLDWLMGGEGDPYSESLFLLSVDAERKSYRFGGIVMALGRYADFLPVSDTELLGLEIGGQGSRRTIAVSRIRLPDNRNELFSFDGSPYVVDGSLGSACLDASRFAASDKGLFLFHTGEHFIRLLDADKTVFTLAGIYPGFRDGPLDSAALSRVIDAAFSGENRVWVIDQRRDNVFLRLIEF
jgi:hypothetical protein